MLSPCATICCAVIYRASVLSYLLCLRHPQAKHQPSLHIRHFVLAFSVNSAKKRILSRYWMLSKQLLLRVPWNSWYKGRQQNLRTASYSMPSLTNTRTCQGFHSSMRTLSDPIGTRLYSM